MVNDQAMRLQDSNAASSYSNVNFRGQSIYFFSFSTDSETRLPLSLNIVFKTFMVKTDWSI